MKRRFGIAFTAALFGLAGCMGNPAANPPGSLPTSPAVTTPTPTPTPSPSAAPSQSPSPSPAIVDLRPGDRGPAVLILQQRLIELGFWLGKPDGVYGSSTTHAVTAFQKANGLVRDGVMGRATATALGAATRVAPRTTSGNRIEVDLRQQILLVVVDGKTLWVMDTSTGKIPGTTPLGHHAVYRQIDGYHTAPLGVLYRPKYIYQGVAIHGYPSVPSYPASHGCIRVTNATMDWLWSSGVLPIGTDVWVY